MTLEAIASDEEDDEELEEEDEELDDGNGGELEEDGEGFDDEELEEVGDEFDEGEEILFINSKNFKVKIFSKGLSVRGTSCPFNIKCRVGGIGQMKPIIRFIYCNRSRLGSHELRSCGFIT
jgi:hypothetical protein